MLQQKGRISADAVETDGLGRIVFRASKSATLEAGSQTTANGNSGGSITVQSADLTEVAGTVGATGSAGKGGSVQILGDKVALVSNAILDASGTSGGGTVLVGGDYQGKNPLVQNASVSYFGKDARIQADATREGDGGKVIVWADGTTRAYGSIFARGGQNGGNGGFVETSGKRFLDFQSQVDTRAIQGQVGTLLLDPTNIYIANDQTSATNAGMTGSDASADLNAPSIQATGAVPDSLLTVNNLQQALATSAVTVSTANGSGAGIGDITVVNPVTWATNNALTLQADRNISINGGITASSAGSFTANAPAGSISVNEAISSSGGVISLNAANTGSVTLVASKPISSASGSVNISAGSVSLPAGSAIAATSGYINLKADSMSLLGSINTGSSGNVMLTPLDSANSVDLGGADTVGVLGLTDAELATITARYLTVGDGGTVPTGGLTVSTPVSVANVRSLTLNNAGGVNINAPVALSQLGSSVLVNASKTGTSPALVVGASGGVTTVGDSPNPNTIRFVADGMELGGTVGSLSTGSYGYVTLDTKTSGKPIVLGFSGTKDSSTALQLTATELNSITGDGITVGGVNTSLAGPISIGGTGLTLGNINWLSLVSGSGISFPQPLTLSSSSGGLRLNAYNNSITQAAAGVITANHIQIDNAGSVGLTVAPNSVNSLAGSINPGTSGSIAFKNSKNLSISSLNNSSPSPTISLETTSGSLNVGTISASGGTVTLTTAGSIIDANGQGTNNVTTGTLTVNAANGLSLDTAVSSLGATNMASNANGIGLSNTGNLTVTGMTDSSVCDAVPPANCTGPAGIKLSNSGTLDINGAISANSAGYGSVFIKATGTASISNTVTGYSVGIVAPVLTVASTITATGSYGGVELLTDALDLSAGTISATTGGVDISTHTSSKPITVGASCTTAGCLLLSDLSTTKIDTPRLAIGNEVAGTVGGFSEPVSGAIDIKMGINRGAGKIGFFSGSTIAQDLTVGGITADMVGAVSSGVGAAVSLNHAANSIAKIIGKTNGGAFSVRSSSALTVSSYIDAKDAADSLYGIDAGAGNVTLKAPTINSASASPVKAGNGLSIIADDISFSADMVGKCSGSSGGCVDIKSLTPARPIEIAGAANANALSITQSDLAFINPSASSVNGGSIMIGDGSGPITFTGNFTTPGGMYPNLRGTTISQSAGTTINGMLDVIASGAINLTESTNQITQLGFSFTSPAAVAVTTSVPSLSLVGSVSAGAGLNIINNGGSIVVDNAHVSTTAGSTTLSASGGITINATTMDAYIAGNPDVYLTVGGNLNFTASGSNKAYVSPGQPTTTYLTFTSTAGMVMFNGSQATATTSGNMGFFNLDGTPAILGAGLALSGGSANNFVVPSGGGTTTTSPPPPTLDACTVDPTLTGCSAVLPALDTCTTNPTAAGCTAVLPSLSTCTTTPTAAGCTAVLPSLDTCTTNPTAAGCTAVLPTLSTCTTTPTAAGCAVVLPSLSTCTTNPTAAGCTAVLPSLSTCTTTPTAAGCTAVLPSLGTCTTTPTAAGCTAVLPTLSTCTTTPTAAGCTAVLPSLDTCTTTPTAAGCTAVLPTLSTCTTNPTTAGCTAVLPPSTQSTTEQLACLTGAAGCSTGTAGSGTTADGTSTSVQTINTQLDLAQQTVAKETSIPTTQPQQLTGSTSGGAGVAPLGGAPAVGTDSGGAPAGSSSSSGDTAGQGQPSGKKKEDDKDKKTSDQQTGDASANKQGSKSNANYCN